MRYSGIQPQYFPRLHYFARILNADVFVVRDDCQFVKKHKYPDGKSASSYQSHTPIKTANGRQLLNIPVQHKGLTPLFDTQISYFDNWDKNHLKTIQITYSKAKNFAQIFPDVNNILSAQYANLAALNIATTIWGILKLLEIDNIETTKLSLPHLNELLKNQNIFRLKQIKLASQLVNLKEFEQLSANEKIIHLIKKVGAIEDYCGGTSVAAYLDHDIFHKNNIKVTVQDWECQKYSQLFSKVEFIPNLSIIDLLMNLSSKEAVEIINS